jgi:hypothetical protein
MLVYYAINPQVKYMTMVAESVKSLRRKNKDISVLIFVFSAKETQVIRFFSGIQCEVRFLENRLDLPPYYFKWLALAEISEKRVLYLDADTYIYEDIASLFARYKRNDFYAREEIASKEGDYLEYVGTIPFRSQIRHAELKEVRKMFRSREMTVFNTGVMLFNHGIGRTVSRQQGFMAQLEVLFREGDVVYPCLNSHIREEIVATVALGRVRGLRPGVLRPSDVPWLMEVDGGRVDSHGIVVHILSIDYPYFAKKNLSKKAFLNLNLNNI